MLDKSINSGFPCLVLYLISKAFKLSLFCVQLAGLPAESLIKLRKNCFIYNSLRILWQKLMQTSLNIFSLFIMPNLILYSACHEQNVLLTFLVFQQSCTSGLWLSSQCITSYPLNTLLNLFWSCFLSYVGLALCNRLMIISVLTPFLVRYWYQCYTIHMEQSRDCISFFYSPE